MNILKHSGLAIMVFFLAFPPVKAKKTESRPRQQEVGIVMSDGIRLQTDVYLPRTGKPCPVILVRTPYSKSAESWMGKAFNLFNVAVVVQDVRGKYKSEGKYYPFINERSDGMETLRWIRQQPWSNGTVGGWGASYLGYTQWAVSDSLDFLVTLLTGAHIYDFIYPDGVFSLQSACNWGFVNASADQNKLSPEKIAAGMRILPLAAADDSTVNEIPFLTDWLTHEGADSYWKQMSYRGVTKAPVLSVAGWYDIFLKTQILDFQSLLNSGNPDNRMVIGPWCHGSQGMANDYGGPKKTSDPKNLFAYTLKTLTGKKKKLGSPLQDARYNLFIMERNEYVGSETWPPAGSKTTPFYLGPEMGLSPEMAVANETMSYQYNPADPYPSHGGTALGDLVGPALQNDNIGRKDQLTFETGVLKQPMILLGEISATLWLSSSVRSTQFVVCVEDVFPDGKIVNIQEGAANVQLSGSSPEPREIQVWATGYQLGTGHKLRVVITSSWFLPSCSPPSVH